ncbi:M1 family metallopeptidase [Mucilaginibacter sp. UR6-11]|uniref:M1 family metallopeptidase n=1 Tax=Mucilaginibacter sp. UR6-11 TaxID=1435644 RepID=UPI001E56A7FB|nr:M1 family metallopeptidase [Mucilaginibacter sp. UR6-11]MCC8426474.1 M1 family metallopeptidase [Mucilaginibacter sp. UR6-11]
MTTSVFRRKRSPLLYLSTDMRIFKLIIMLILGASLVDVHAQAPAYDPHQVFVPVFYPPVNGACRTAGGAPGPRYWQNRADYLLKVNLDTGRHRISGTAVITYVNNSPDRLDFLWLQLDQNIYRRDSRGEATSPVAGGRFAVNAFTTGDEVKGVYLLGRGKAEKADYCVRDTRMQVRLQKALRPGSKISIKVAYAFNIPAEGSDRMGRTMTKNGWIYEVAQWYPRMAVYDDVSGWNVVPYLGASEFYLDYGDFDYTITAPAGLVVAGSGELLNPAEVLTPLFLRRLAAARNSDRTVMIRDTTDLSGPSAHPHRTSLSWHFLCKNTRDVSWAASKAFLWDAARINLPGRKKALAQSLYPVESRGINAWSRATEYTKAAIELYSGKWFSYTYPLATSVAGGATGMEYPGLVFCDRFSQTHFLWNVINHEFGHNWFPMIVGSNERKYGWMDEGLNTFINKLDTRDFNNGEYDAVKDQHKAAPALFPADDEAIMNSPDVLQDDHIASDVYNKPALALSILREHVLGQDRFDYAFRAYIRRWAFKHPTPWDFFHTMDNAAGEDLSWFWQEWFFTTMKLDQAIKEIAYIGDDPAKGAMITLENLGGMALPVTLALRQVNGKTDTVRLPAEIWQRGGTWTFYFPSTVMIKYAVLDPAHELPDIRPENNDRSGVRTPAGLTAATVVNNYLEAVGGREKLKTIKQLAVTSACASGGLERLRMDLYRQPGIFLQNITLPASHQLNIQHLAISGDSLVLRRMGYPVVLTDSAKESLRANYRLFPELDFGNKDYTLKLEPVLQILGDRLAYLVLVRSPQGALTRYFYDRESGLKIKQYPMAADGTAMEWGDYRDIGNGIKWPFYEKNTNVVQSVSEYKVTQVVIGGGDLSNKPIK